MRQAISCIALQAKHTGKSTTSREHTTLLSVRATSSASAKRVFSPSSRIMLAATNKWLVPLSKRHFSLHCPTCSIKCTVNHPWMLNILCTYLSRKINLFLSLASVSLLIATSFSWCGLLGGGWWVGQRVNRRYDCSSCCEHSSTTMLFTSSMAVCCSVAMMTTVITSTCKLF